VAALHRTAVPRRDFLTMIALGAAAALTGCGTTHHQHGPVFPAAVPGPATVVTRAPAPTHDIALTIDDGYDVETLAAYVKLATDTGLPLTFDAIGKLAHNWQAQVPALAPLIEKGQVQIANHTFNHLDLPTLSDTRVASEISQNEEWIEQTFGVTARPYLRPPSGFHDSRVDKIAGGLGFTKILMWQGSFGDATLVSPTTLMAAAKTALLPGAIVVGHANAKTVTGLYSQITELIRDRNLQPRTLDQMFGTNRSVGS
jgi:peptidoglycan/xylan/chitin deacetylase (PgdA/CDA1 family)